MLKPPIAQFIINLLLQLAAFAAAIAFGVYAVKSVDVAIKGNNYANQAIEIADIANKLSLLALCLSNTDVVCQKPVMINLLTNALSL
jgi:hypothetical protein